MLPRTLRWLHSAEELVYRRTQGTVRILTDADTPALRRLCDAHPIEHCYPRSLLDTGRRAGPLRDINRGLFLGIDDLDRPGELEAACWVGSNVVPVAEERFHGELFALALRSLGRRFGSIFGPREAVLGVWSVLEEGPQQARAVRDYQPLMTIETPSQILPNRHVRVARREDFRQVLPAAVAMFTEELGYSPFIDGTVSYRNRVEHLINRGHCLIEEATKSSLTFKADFGVVTEHCVQIQGVWMSPDVRGQGRAAASMSAVVENGLTLAPVVSLYVNDFNTAALRTYDRVGFEQIGEFATVLL